MGSAQIPISVRIAGHERLLEIDPQKTVGEILLELDLIDATVVLSGTKVARNVKLSELDLTERTVLDILWNRANADFLHKPTQKTLLQRIHSYLFSFFRPRVAENAVETTPKFFFGFCKKCFTDGFGIEEFKGEFFKHYRSPHYL